jgi:hypothetical protein
MWNEEFNTNTHTHIALKASLKPHFHGGRKRKAR